MAAPGRTGILTTSAATEGSSQRREDQRVRVHTSARSLLQPTAALIVIPAPLELSDLPAIDAVIVSHNHYDHLGANTTRAMAHVFALAWIEVVRIIRRIELDVGRALGNQPTKLIVDYGDQIQQQIGWRRIEAIGAAPRLSVQAWRRSLFTPLASFDTIEHRPDSECCRSNSRRRFGV